MIDSKLRDLYKTKILSLKNEEEFYINGMEGSGVRVVRNNNEFELYEIPLYGSNEFLENVYSDDQIDSLIDEFLSWT